MIYFPISFEFAGLTITATAHKISKTHQASTQYHVMDWSPKLNGIPEVWMFIHDPVNEKFTFNIPSPDYLMMPGNIIDAIRMECEKRKIEYV